MRTTVLATDRQQATTVDDEESGAALRTWAHLVGVLAARMYRTFLLGLVAIAVAPVLFAWGSYIVDSGSMEPSIQVGDIVIAKPYTDDQLIRVGRVFVYDDPAPGKDRTMVHRIVELRDDGDYTTAGDANEVTDFTPLPRSGVEATAVLLVPYVGLPVTWTRSGEWAHLALWLLLTMAAFALALRNLEGEPPRYGLMRLLRDWWSRRTPPSDPPGGDSTTAADPPAPRPAPLPSPQRSRRVLRSRIPLVGLAGLLMLSTLAATASAGFTAQTRTSGMSWTVGPWVQPYVAAVLADRPYGFWLMDESGGAQYAADRSGNNRTGQYYGNLALGTQGGLPRNPGTAVDNTGGRVILGPQAVPAPNAYSIELWFRTTSTSQSYLAGFEDDRDASFSLFGTDADRSVTMESNGRLTFGRWPWNSQTITTPRAYNDGTWHHLVVTSNANRATTIYVDGVAVASGTTSSLVGYSGFWRVGQGSIGLFNTPAFNGDLDNVAIYHSTLPASRVAAHWAAR